MFGFSLAELIVVFLVAIIFIKPQDLPQIAHFFGRLYYKARRFFNEIKAHLKSIEKDLGLDELKHELDRGIAEEKLKIEGEKKEMTKILDIYGNYHEVNIDDVSGDMSEEELKAEIAKYNDINSTPKALQADDAASATTINTATISAKSISTTSQNPDKTNDGVDSQLLPKS